MKRKATVLIVLSLCIVLGYLSFLSWSVGFVLTKYVSSKTTGEPHRLLRSRIIPFGKYRFHLHHWLWSSFIILIFTLYKSTFALPSDLFYGFFGAIVFHGIYYYNDWYKIIIPRQVQNLIIGSKLTVEES